MQYPLFTRSAVSCFFALICSYASAQPDKGRFMVLGDISGSYQSSDERLWSLVDHAHAKSFSINPEVGYFLAKNFAIGASLPVALTWTTYLNRYTGNKDQKTSSRSWSAGPFARYYLPIDGKLFAFAEAGYTWGSVYQKTQDLISGGFLSTATTSSHQFRSGAGVAYFLNRSAGLELMISYRQNYMKGEADAYTDTEKDKYVQVEIGFQFYLGK
jgi:hypothetical protein